MEDVGVGHETALGKGDVAHVLDCGVAGVGVVELGGPWWGLDEVFGEGGFFGPDAAAEGEGWGWGDVVGGGRVDCCGADAFVLGCGG